MADDEIIRKVYEVLESRRDNPIDSYTSNIMKDSDKKAEDKILEKIAEECGETLIASKNDENLVYESVDLIFHTLLLLVYKGVSYDEKNNHKTRSTSRFAIHSFEPRLVLVCHAHRGRKSDGRHHPQLTYHTM